MYVFSCENHCENQLEYILLVDILADNSLIFSLCWRALLFPPPLPFFRNI